MSPRRTPTLEGSGFSSAAELAGWLEFCEWRALPDADPEAFVRLGEALGWVAADRVELRLGEAERRAPKAPPRVAAALPDPALPPWARDAVAGLPALLTTEDATAVLRTSRRNLYRWISAGKLEAVRSGVGGSARVLIPRSSVVTFLQRISE